MIELLAAKVTYQVTYRICDKSTATGSASERYQRLTDRLAKLGTEDDGFKQRGHASTSSWIVTYPGDAQKLLQHLTSAVTAKFDRLDIVEVHIGNRAQLPTPTEC